MNTLRWRIMFGLAIFQLLQEIILSKSTICLGKKNSSNRNGFIPEQRVRYEPTRPRKQRERTQVQVFRFLPQLMESVQPNLERTYAITDENGIKYVIYSRGVMY